DVLDSWLHPGGSLQPSDAIAKKLELSDNDTERYWLWQAMGEAWAGRCRPTAKALKGMDPEKRQPVLNTILDGQITYEVLTEDDFSMYRYTHSEMLDLDHLSPTVPLLSYAPDVVTATGPRSLSPSVSGTDGSAASSNRGGWRFWLPWSRNGR